jgi:subtilisin family serine protease
MKNLHFKIIMYVMAGLVLTVALHVRVSYAQTNESRELMVDRFLIKFTEQIVEMPDPQEKVTPQAIINRAAPVRSALLEIDSEMEITRFRPDFQPSDTLRIDKAGRVIRRHDWSRIYRVRLTKEVNYFEIETQLKKIAYVEWLDPPLHIQPLYIPNDLHGEGTQWNIPKVLGTQTWDITRGDPEIRIQIMDFGIAPHNDINNKVTNPGEPFAGNHGLAVAGVAGAETDNNDGIASLGFETSVVDASLANPNPGENFEDMVARYFESSWNPESIDFDDLNADIINCSFFTYMCFGFDQFGNCIDWESTNFNVVEEAVENALEEDRIIVAAAGNIEDSASRDDFPYTLWPASYDGVIAVSASNSSDEFENGYNHGNFVNLSAPAIDILLLDLNNQFMTDSGTSFASPLVAATVALMLDVNPGLKPAQTAAILEESADEVGQYSYDTNGWNQYMGHGRLNAFKAVSRALPHQFFNQFFAYSGSFSIGNSHIYGDSFFEYGTLIVPHGEVAVIDDTFYGYGSVWANIEVSGVLILSGSASINDMKIDVKNNGKLIVQPGAIISRVPIVIQNGGIADIRGGTFTLGSNEWFTSYGKAGINNASFTCASGSACNGVLFQGSGVSGSTVDNTTLTGTLHGLMLTNASSVQINSSTFSNNTNAGLTLASSNYLVIGDDNVFTLNGSHGLYADFAFGLVGANNRFEQNQGDGIFAEGGSLLWANDTGSAPELVSTLNGGYGMRATYSSNIAISYYDAHQGVLKGDNGVYLNFTNEARAEGYAVIEARKTWWGQYPPSPSQFETGTGGAIDWSQYLSNPVVMKAALPNAPLSGSHTLQDHQDRALLLEISRNMRDAENLEGYLEELSLSNIPIEHTTGIRVLSSWYAGDQQWDKRTGLQSALEVLRDAESLRYMERAQVYEHLARFDYSAAGDLLRDSKYLDPDDIARFRSVIDSRPAAESLSKQAEDSEDVLLSNYPNPFNPATRIHFRITRESQVRLVVYDILGRNVQTLVNELVSPGQHQATFDGSRLSSGIYIYQLEANGQISTGKMLLVK